MRETDFTVANNIEKRNSTSRHPQGRQGYVRPTLTEFGQVGVLTQAGSAPANEQLPNMTNCGMSMNAMC